MLCARVRSHAHRHARSIHTNRTSLQAVPRLPNGSLTTFRDEAFRPSHPHLLPRHHFEYLPAITKWFTSGTSSAPPALDTSYLSEFGDTLVPVELSTPKSFERIPLPLSAFLHYTCGPVSSTTASPDRPRAYVAQAPLSDVPAALRDDLPTPALVLEAGRADVYGTSVWLGPAPTYTPLHRDPNPNLLVQLAGRKRVRLFTPEVGRALFAHVQREIGANGDAIFRGEEMMCGPEREVLHDAVWSDDQAERPWLEAGWEACLDVGDGLFVPKGWWHSVKGLGTDMTGSVNWWFR